MGVVKGGNKWQNQGYLNESDAITKALVAHNVVRFAGYQVMLPGAKGFNLNSYVNLNPSYFILPGMAGFCQPQPFNGVEGFD